MSVSVIASSRQGDAREASSRPEASCALDAVAQSRPADWSLQRNCSISPASLAAVFALLAALSSAVAVFFWTQGAVLVLPFAVVEVLALGLAFVWYARHATDGERLWLDGRSLVLEVERAGRIARERLDTTWLVVQPPGVADASLRLRLGDRCWRLGQHAAAGRRARVADELKRALIELQRA